MKHYYISGIIINTNKQKNFQIMEESETGQVCIALVPYNHIAKEGYKLARQDAEKIVRGLNLLERLFG